MSLATRCTACGTVFRVVQDQLKISEGWVRCGRCKEVFNALEGLFDLDREAPPQWEPPPPLPTPGMTTVDVQLPDDEVPAAPPLQPAVEAAASKAQVQPAAVVPPPAPPPPVAPTPAPAPALSVERALAPPPPATEAPEFADAGFAPSEAASTSTPSAIWAPSADEEHPVAPNFLREAERRARWESPRARVALAVLAFLLLVALALQGAYQYRDIIAAHWPQTRPLLVEACAWLDCSVGPLRRIEEIAVESTALTYAGPGAPPDALRLSVALRSRSAMPLAMPTIDLSLTDINGELVARRALSAADFRSPTTTLAPGAESNLQLLLTVDGRRVAGYTVEIFYP
jgi:predicted Zn finger-like uncharacterized protein